MYILLVLFLWRTQTNRPDENKLRCPGAPLHVQVQNSVLLSRAKPSMEPRSWALVSLGSRAPSFPQTPPWCLEPYLTCLGPAVHQLSDSQWSGPPRGPLPWANSQAQAAPPCFAPWAAGWLSSSKTSSLGPKGTEPVITCQVHTGV